MECSRQTTVISINRRGTAATEFAFVFPLMMVITIACVDLGRVAYTSMALISGVSSAGEFAATYSFNSYTRSAGEQELVDRIMDELETLSNFDPAMLTTTVEFDESDPDQMVVQINASYVFHSVTSLPGLPDEVLLCHQLCVVRYR